MRFKFLIGGLLALALGAGIAVVRDRARPFTFHYENVLGTSMDLTVVASSERAAQIGEAAVLEQIDHDAAILSGYAPDSEFSRWFATQGLAVRVSPELFEVLGLFDQWRARTGGALDASAERIARVWKAAASRHQLPSAADLALAASDVRQQHWRLDPAARTATHLSATPLMLNTFTKSYIVDRAARAAMATRAIRGVVVNIGGDLVVRGDRIEPVSVTDPRDYAENGRPLARLAVRNRAVATSGGYRRGFDIGGRHYSHIVDPRTGRPAGHVLSATVAADDAVDAGARDRVLRAGAGGERAAGGADPGCRVRDGAGRRPPDRKPRMAASADRAGASSPRGRSDGAAVRLRTELESRFRVDGGAGAGPARRLCQATVRGGVDRGQGQIPGAHDRAVVREGPLPARVEGLVPRRSAARDGGRHQHHQLGRERHARAGQLHVQVGRQGSGRQPGEAGHLRRPDRSRARARTYQLLRQEMDFSGVPKRIPLAAGTEVAAATLDYHEIAGR